MYLIFDTETTGLPKRWDAPITDTDNWPRCIQIAWQLHDAMGNCIEHQDYLVKPDGFNIPYDAEKIHGISTELAQEQGISLAEVLEKFNEALSKTKFVVGQNVKFDLNIMGAEFVREDVANPLQELPVLDTCTEHTASLCQIPGGRYGKFKLPTLTELHQFLFNVPFAEAHNATADVEATTRCFFELIRKQEYTVEQLDVQPDYFQKFSQENPDTIQLIGLKHINLKRESAKINERLQKEQAEIVPTETNKEAAAQLADIDFVHLHNHSQFSILQSTISIKDLVNAAAKENMPAVALTDHGNMMGAFHFVSAVGNHNKTVKAQHAEAEENGEEKKGQLITPIIGCEFFVCENHTDKTRKDNGYQIVLLAKNKKGYHNLAKLSSAAFTNGFYYVPRIDKQLIEQYKEDLICLTGNLYGEVPSKVLNFGENQAEEALLWWKDTFADDLYIELMRHNQEDENRVNPVLIQFAKKHDIKLIATNNTYYAEQENANAHDILLCVKDGEKQATPIGRGRGYRYGLPNQEYYFKSSEEMKALFRDIPEAIVNIQEVVDKIEPFELARDVLLPAFDIPNEFKFEEDEADGGKRGENAYLKHLTYEGAKKRYGEITPEIKERLDFELSVIENTGYPGYFLIVEDFIREARKMDVSVGPGPGSAAGSVVAYCLWITNIDPIKYDLLFERFLNPDRVSMPDIDIDFDDEGRGRVMDYVIEKYGANQVAQIITYGTMAAKSSLRDVGRVMNIPLPEVDRVAKTFPTHLKASLKKVLGEKDIDPKLKSEMNSEDVDKAYQFRNLADGNDDIGQMIRTARKLEGSIRNTGIHACGVVITPDEITKYVPVKMDKESNMLVSQFDNSVAEDAGLLKMDFLGLKTLTIIRDAIRMIKAGHGVDIDPDAVPLDDPKTYELFQRGETVGIFQYESGGMQKYMKELAPTAFEDLIAMNALYRPGPLEYIPNFIARKHGREPITFDLPAMEEYLQETYGITVYQEQVMLLSQKLAGFTKGEADMLRKAMGKKKKKLIDQMHPKFVEGGKKNGHPEEVLNKVWKDWEAFASYAFNKSHSTCYAFVAFQTAFLKAHYPAEFMASVLTHNKNDLTKLTFFLRECHRMNCEVLGPNINESASDFTVNKDGAIRFGLSALKGVGEGPVAAILEERAEGGSFKSLFDMLQRLSLQAVNKRVMESLVLGGALDLFPILNRATYFAPSEKYDTFLEHLLRYGNAYQSQKAQSANSLFGDSEDAMIPEPNLPEKVEWSLLESLNKEKEVTGIYISGHPLDDYKIEVQNFTTCSLDRIEQFKGQKLNLAGIMSAASHRISKKGTGWGLFTLADYHGAIEFPLFSSDYAQFSNILQQGNVVFIKGQYQKRYNSDEYQLKILEVKMLEDIAADMTESITLKLPIDLLSDSLIDEIDLLCKNNKGKHKLKMVFLDRTNKTSLKTVSSGCKVNADNDFVAELDRMGIGYRVN